MRVCSIKSMVFLGVVLVFAMPLAAPAPAAEVDLSPWTAESYPAVSGFPAGDWTVAGGGLSVFQSLNGQPTLFCSDFSAIGTMVEGRIRVSADGGDDDYIGFALGFNVGDTANPAADYLLVDWKRRTQFFNFGSPSDTPGSTGFEGLAVSHVFGIPTADEFWGHVNFDHPSSDLSNGLTELQRGATLGGTGWVHGTEYTFVFEFDATSLKVFVDGTLELDIAGAFSDGSLCFYNFSQSSVTYSGFEVEPLCEDPSPLSQGYWHRQCLGVPMEEGGIDPGRGRGPSSPTEADFTKTYMPAVGELLETLIFENAGACQGGMHASPPSDTCEKAIKQFTALLFSRESGRLQDGCTIDVSAQGCAAGDIGDLIDESAALINTEDEDSCAIAQACAAAVNEGTALTESALAAPAEQAASPATRPARGIGRGEREASSAPASAAVEREAVAPDEPTVHEPAGFIAVPDAPDAPAAAEAPDADAGERSLERHLAVLANPAAPSRAVGVSQDALLTALSGGHDPETRVRIVRALVDQVDVGLLSLLAGHLEDIRAEAAAFERQDVVEEADRLLAHVESLLE